jgi:hypothetical protein
MESQSCPYFSILAELMPRLASAPANMKYMCARSIRLSLLLIAYSFFFRLPETERLAPAHSWDAIKQKGTPDIHGEPLASWFASWLWGLLPLSFLFLRSPHAVSFALLVRGDRKAAPSRVIPRSASPAGPGFFAAKSPREMMPTSLLSRFRTGSRRT